MSSHSCFLRRLSVQHLRMLALMPTPSVLGRLPDARQIYLQNTFFQRASSCSLPAACGRLFFAVLHSYMATWELAAQGALLLILH